MGTFIVGAIVLAVVALALYSTFRPKQKSACGCGCSGCDPKTSGSCH